MPKKKKDPLASSGRRQRAYELPNLINVQAPQDPLRQMEDDAIRDLSNEYRILRVEEMIQKKKRQLEKSAPTSDISMPIRQIEDDALRDLSSEYRQLRVEEMIQKKKRQLEKSAPTSDISMQKQNLELVTTIFRLAKEIQPQQGKDDTLAYVAMFKDLLLESAKMQNQGGRAPSFFESIITDPNLYQRTRDIFGSSGAAKGSIDLEIEKLRGERELSMKKMDLEWRKDSLERDAQDRRTDNILSIFAPFAAGFAGPVAQRMQEFGQQQATAHNPTRSSSPPNTGAQQTNQNPVNAPIIQPSVVKINCDCGYSGDVTFQGSAPKALKCPSCDRDLYVEGTTYEEISAGDFPASSPGSEGHYRQPER